MDDTALVAMLDALRDDVRRGARAALAAKAAAEEINRAPSDDVWARALLPVLDNLDRCEEEARKLASAYEKPKGGWFRPRPADPRVATLARAICMTRDLHEEALSARGYTVERPQPGVRFDPTRHRTVEIDAGAPRETVVRWVRAGLRKADRFLREADVVVGTQSTEVTR